MIRTLPYARRSRAAVRGSWRSCCSSCSSVDNRTINNIGNDDCDGANGLAGPIIGNDDAREEKLHGRRRRRQQGLQRHLLGRSAAALSSASPSLSLSFSPLLGVFRESSQSNCYWGLLVSSSRKQQRQQKISRCWYGSSPSPNEKKTENEEGESAGKNPHGYHGHWLNQLKSPPNLITIARIASTPFLAYLIVTEQHYAALAGCFVAGGSDVLDGYLAKRYGMSTVLGTYLDPLADKLLINVLSLSLWYSGTLPMVLVVIWMVKDLGLVTFTYLHVKRNTLQGTDVTLKVNPTLTSKINTALQFATLSLAIVHPIYPVMNGDALTALCWVTGGTTFASAASYVGFSAFKDSGSATTNRTKDAALMPPTKERDGEDRSRSSSSTPKK